MSVTKAILKKGKLLDETRFAPYEGYTVFIVDERIIILEEEIIEDFDVPYYKAIFNIVEVVD